MERSKRRFTIGDKVVVRSDLVDYIESNGQRGLINTNMRKMCDFVMQITRIIHDNFTFDYRAIKAGDEANFDTDSWAWKDEWFEPYNKFKKGDIVSAITDNLKIVSIKNGYIGEVIEVIDRNKVKVKTIRSFDGGNGSYVVKSENLKRCYLKEETIMERKEIKMVECACCGEEIPESIIAGYNSDGEPICDDCYEENYVRCEDCGCLVDIDYAYKTIHGDYVCEDCKDNYYVCADCGELIPDGEEYYVTSLNGDDYYICEYCKDSGYYHYCYECDDLYHEDDMVWDEDDGEWFCGNCYDEHGKGKILSYHGFSNWKEHFVDNRNESTLKGFELEVENYKENVDNKGMAEEVCGIMNDFIVFEHDGSLDNGFENISNPFTMPWLYKHEDDFETMLKAFVNNGFTSHNPGTCGLHIHVNKEQLATNGRTPDEVISNILIIMETFKDELVKFSRRGHSALDRWAAFYTDYGENLSYKLIAKKKKENENDRYYALNLTNTKTIEFRIFRGTLKFEAFMGSIELVDNIVEIARNENIDGLSWDDIISYGGKYVKDYSMNERDIESTTKVSIVPNPAFPYKKGDIVRCSKYGQLYVGAIEDIDEAMDSFTINGVGYRFSLDSVYKNSTYKTGDTVLVNKTKKVGVVVTVDATKGENCIIKTHDENGKETRVEVNYRELDSQVGNWCYSKGDIKQDTNFDDDCWVLDI